MESPRKRSCSDVSSPLGTCGAAAGRGCPKVSDSCEFHADWTLALLKVAASASCWLRMPTLRRIMKRPGVRFLRWKRPAHFMRTSMSSRASSSQVVFPSLRRSTQWWSV